LRATGDQSALIPTQTGSRLGVCDVLVRALSKSVVDIAYGVPDSVLVSVLDALASQMPTIILPREDLAVAAALGAYLRGHRPLVFMKNAGLGNALDALLSLAMASRMPLVVLIGWAGSGPDTLPHHTVWGDRTRAALGLFSDEILSIDESTEESHFVKRINRAFEQNAITSILVMPT